MKNYNNYESDDEYSDSVVSSESDNNNDKFSYLNKKPKKVTKKEPKKSTKLSLKREKIKKQEVEKIPRKPKIDMDYKEVKPTGDYTKGGKMDERHRLLYNKAVANINHIGRQLNTILRENDELEDLLYISPPQKRKAVEKHIEQNELNILKLNKMLRYYTSIREQIVSSYN